MQMLKTGFMRNYNVSPKRRDLPGLEQRREGHPRGVKMPYKDPDVAREKANERKRRWRAKWPADLRVREFPEEP
jgi:hypothetical protein